MTAQTVIAEAGHDMSPFPTEKHFVSWLGLCPNNRITGGRVVTRRTRKVQNSAAKAFRLAAQSLHHSPSAMGAFLRRMKARHGTPKAITATARKLAILFYRMLKYGMDYIDKGEKAYQDRIQAQQIRSLQRHAKSMGYKLVTSATGGRVS